MPAIQPAILARSEKEFRAKVERVKALGGALHVDVMDGAFVNNTTWAPPERMRDLLGDTPFEAHLMVANPEYAVPVWLAAGASRVVFHAEATPRLRLILNGLVDDRAKLAVALNPGTPVSRIAADLSDIAAVLVMGVEPGWSGQPFQEVAIEKVRDLKARKPSLVVAVDGGVNPDRAKALADAGADVLVAGSAITDAEDPAVAMREFMESLR